ncbi:MAG: AAA family ATPase, partial [Bradymonadaceae bacterium]
MGRRVGERERLVEIVADGEEELPGAFHYVRGNAEIGKTRLISEVTASLKLEGCTVVRVDCTEPMHAWELVHELLDRIVELGASRKLRKLEYYESYLLILKRLATLDNDSDTQLSQVVDHGWLRQAFEDAVETLRPQKLVLVIEDIHRADVPSRQFLAECYAPESGSTMPDGLASGLRGETLDQFRAGERVTFHEIEGLTRSDIHRFFEGRLGLDEPESGWIDQVDECASGRPGYLEEVCRTLID